ncbi:MAG: preprotein translocase subunit YajC [Desulfovibrio sp.]|nr:preprotein translocase subunit YajC [Desulfovibrio sp.]
MLWTTAAHAMGPAPGGTEGAGWQSLIPFILMFAVFYFLLIRPQQKRAKEHKAMLNQLKRGDEVVTAGGLYGRILETADDHVILDLGDSKVKVSRSAISAVASMARPAQPEKKSKKAEEKEKAGDKPADDA